MLNIDENFMPIQTLETNTCTGVAPTKAIITIMTSIACEISFQKPREKNESRVVMFNKQFMHKLGKLLSNYL